MKKTVNIIITLEGDWTERHTTIRCIEKIPMDATVVSTYDIVTDTTTVSIHYTDEREANNNERRCKHEN